MSDRVVVLSSSRCPSCNSHLGMGDHHLPWCLWGFDEMKAKYYEDESRGLLAINAIPKQRMDWSRVRPSLGDACPRSGCGLRMARTEHEGTVTYTCVEGHYTARERQS